jgi:defect in organelle trafficking protein DotD
MDMFKKNRMFLLVSLGFVLSACSGGGSSTIYSGSVYSGSELLDSVNLDEQDDTVRLVSDKLLKTAYSVDKELQRLAAIEQASKPGLFLPKAPNARSIGMAQQLTMDWVGPVEPLLIKIAKITHYQLRVLGQEPPLPVLVTVHKRLTSAADIVRNIQFQVTRHAQLVLYPSQRVMELRYGSAAS